MAASSDASAWGQGIYGQLGDGFEFNSFVPVAVSGLSEVRTVAAHGSNGLALLDNGTVVAWGPNGFGQLGNGTTDASNVPVPVSGLSEVTAIAAGGTTNLALLENGTVMAWGANGHGQLGNGTTTDSYVPVAVSGLSEVTAIATTGEHGLALLGNGHVMAWGENFAGQLGNGTTTDSDVPVPVSELSEVTAISAGEYFSLAVLSDGEVMAWGFNSHDRAGIGYAEKSLVPVPVCAPEGEGGCAAHLSGVATVSAGSYHSLALMRDETVMAWGFNGSGQLGDGTTTTREVPVKVSGLSEVTAVAAGGYHSLAVLGNGTAMAWGWNQEGQLGDPSAEGKSLVPVPVSGLSEVTAVSAGRRYSLAAGAAPPPVPQIAAIEPTYGGGGGGAAVTITGINFTGATSVKFGSVGASSFAVDSSTSISATAPAGTGTVDVTVTTPEGTSPISRADRYRYSPTLRSISPRSGYPAGGTPVVLTGTNFNDVTAVKFGPNSAPSFSVESESQITAVSPAGTGTVDVTVITEGGSSPETEADRFTYSSTPVIEGVGPNHGSPSGGTAVTISGSNFTGATAVRFGSQAAKSFTVHSATEITALSPPFAGGGEDAVGIYVTTPNGTNGYNGCGTAERGFIYEPTITSVEPNTGPAAGGTEVTINGVAFQGVIWGEEPLCTLATPVTQWVDFGSTSAQSVEIVSGSEITAVAPPGTGTVDVTIQDAYPLGSSPTVPGDQFSYEPEVVKANPTLSTEASANSLGGTITDKATLAGGQSPGGTIAFKAYGPDDSSCSGAVAFEDTATVSGNGDYESAAFTPAAAGTYRWVASYSGDGNNEAVAGSCGDAEETSTIAKASSSTASPISVDSPPIIPQLPVNALLPNVAITHRPRHHHRHRRGVQRAGGPRYSFRFADQAPGVTFYCRLDRRPFKPCRSPKVYRRLKRGFHLFRVKSVDGAGRHSRIRVVRFCVGMRKRQSHVHRSRRHRSAHGNR